MTLGYSECICYMKTGFQQKKLWKKVDEEWMLTAGDIELVSISMNTACILP